MHPTSLLSLLKTYCCVTTSNQFRSTSSPRWASSHSFSLMRAVTWVLKASSLRPDRRSPKLTRNSSIFVSTNSVLRGRTERGEEERFKKRRETAQRRKKATGRSAHLNLVACVSTVTENPSSPEVFLQVGYTWYLDSVRFSD